MIRIVRSQSAEAEGLTGFRKSARAAKIAEGLLPPPIHLGGKAAGFLAHELEAVISARATGATDDEVKDIVRNLVAARSAKETTAA